MKKTIAILAMVAMLLMSFTAAAFAADELGEVINGILVIDREDVNDMAIFNMAKAAPRNAVLVQIWGDEVPEGTKGFQYRFPLLSKMEPAEKPPAFVCDLHVLDGYWWDELSIITMTELTEEVMDPMIQDLKRDNQFLYIGKTDLAVMQIVPSLKLN